MMKRQKIHHQNYSGSKGSRITKIPYSRRFFRPVFKCYIKGFREKASVLFPAQKSQYFSFLKYWLFFNRKNLTSIL
jgi:hypothetical protein